MDGHGAQREMFPGYVGSLSKYMKSRSSKYKDLVIQGSIYKPVWALVREDGWNFGVERALKII